MTGSSFEVALVFAVALTTASAGLAEAPGAPEEANVLRSGDLELLQSVRAVASRVEAERGEKIRMPPLVVRGAADEHRASWVDADWSEESTGRLAARGRAWRDIGLGDAVAPAELARLLARDLEGMAIDPGGRRLWVAADRLTEADFGPTEGESDAASLLLATGVRPDEPLVAHYLSHILDRFPERKDPAAATTDALLAGAAWAEGAANVVAMKLLFDGLGLSPDVLDGRISPGRVLDGTLLPASFRSSGPALESFLFFVYEEGFAQAAASVRAGGWDAFRAASRSRRTTADVLHPDRPPVPAATVPDPALRLPVGYREADRDTVGAQGIITLISTGTGKDNLGLLAGEGWSGDSLLRYEPVDPEETSAGVTVWSTRWRTAAHASDFEYGLLRAFRARGGDASVARAAGGAHSATIDGRVAYVLKQGTSVLVTVSPTSLAPVLEAPNGPSQDEKTAE